MLKTKIKNKIIILFSIFISLSALLFLVVKGLNDNILFFKTPSEIFSSEDINVKKIDVDLSKGKVLIAFNNAHTINFDDIKEKILINGQNATDMEVINL